MALFQSFVKSFPGCSLIILAVAINGSFASGQEKKTTPAKPAVAAPVKPAAVAPKAGAGAAAGTRTSGPTTGGPNTHGPTTGNPTGKLTTSTPRPNTPVPHDVRPNTTNPMRPVNATHFNHGAASPVGARELRTNTGEVRMRTNGRPADVHITGRNIDIHHGLAGGRRVEMERADHSRVVAYRGGHGYIERPYRYGDREFARRSYYYNGRAYDRYYGRYYYRGAYVNYYTPAYYYRPAFYGYVGTPWAAPVPYAWGWNANPWYGYYGVAYFQPYPVYPSASFWLTDYLISASLAAAYQANVNAQSQQLAQAQQAQQFSGGPLPADAAGLTPEVKNLIAQEVQQQINLEYAESQAAQTGAPDPRNSSIERMLSDNVQHVFVVGRELDVINASGAECAVTEGDVLQLVGPPPPNSPSANLVVLSSKGGVECQRSATVTVQIVDLQEMQNHMRETVDAGMGEMQSKKSSLPAVPISASGEPMKATFVSTAPPPEQNVGGLLSEQMKVADTAENQTLAEAQSPQMGAPQTQTPLAQNGAQLPPPPPPPPATVNISIGQTIDQVTAALGQPTSVADLGAKKIYIYPQMKVTFKDGVVSDVK